MCFGRKTIFNLLTHRRPLWQAPVFLPYPAMLSSSFIRYPFPPLCQFHTFNEVVLEYIYFNGFLLWICIPLSFFLILLAPFSLSFFLSVSLTLSLTHCRSLSFTHYTLLLHPIFRSFVIRINWIALQWYKQWVSGCEGFFFWDLQQHLTE